MVSTVPSGIVERAATNGVDDIEDYEDTDVDKGKLPPVILQDGKDASLA